MTGFPEIVKAENYVIDHELGDVISQSFGATEQTFPSALSICSACAARSNARPAPRHRASPLRATPAHRLRARTSSDLYPFPVNALAVDRPARDRARRHAADPRRERQPAPARLVWNDGYGAAGGGLYDVLRRVRRSRMVSVDRRSAHRGVPDISMSAAVDGGGATSTTRFQAAATRAWHIFGGTSEAAPLFAGDRRAGRPVRRPRGRRPEPGAVPARLPRHEARSWT